MAQISPKRIAQKLSVIEGLVNDQAAWTPTANYGEQACRLIRALKELEAMQETFRVVDADQPFSVRAERLQKWLQTHPQYKNDGVTLVDDLPEAKGRRGLRASAALSAEDVAVTVPTDCFISTETATCSVELGPLTDEPRLKLTEMPHALLALHIACEHAKALATPPPAADAPIPPVVTRSQSAANRAAWETKAYGAPIPEPHNEEDCDDEGHGHSHSGGGNHGHSHGGGSHGHSHGGKPCTGHGDEDDAASRKPMHRTELQTGAHPWGSQWRAYLSVLPSPQDMRTCLYWGEAEMGALAGTYAQATCASFLRDVTKNYLMLFPAFGPSLEGDARAKLIQGFDKYFTWAGFKWAMSVMMSRQNIIAGGRQTAVLLREAPSASSFDPFTEWPAGVRRYGARSETDVALIPMFDFANHEAGPVTSFFTEAGSVIQAKRAFAAGEEFVMGYGPRASDRTLQFQGFTAATPEDVATDTTAVEVSLASLLPPGTSPLADGLWPIRVNVLKSLTIQPEHNAQRHLRSPGGALMAAFREAQQAGTREAASAFERIKWSLPFTFTVTSFGGWSHELTSFARAGAIRGKPEAADALKSAAAVRKAAHDALEKHEAEVEARRVARVAAGGPEESEEDDDEFELPPMGLGVVSTDSEVRALTSLVAVFEAAIAAVRDGFARVQAEGVEVPASSPVLSYRALQLQYLAAARDRAASLLEEAKRDAPGGAGGEGGDGSKPATLA